MTGLVSPSGWYRSHCGTTNPRITRHARRRSVRYSVPRLANPATAAAVAALGREFIAEVAQSMVQWFVPFAKNGLPLGFRSRSMCSMRDPPDPFGPSYRLGTSELSETAPGENRRRANPPLSHPCSASGARRRSPTTTVPLGTSTTPWYAPSPSFWSTWGRPKQDFCASLRTQPRATRANRAQSTAHH